MAITATICTGTDLLDIMVSSIPKTDLLSMEHSGEEGDRKLSQGAAAVRDEVADAGTSSPKPFASAFSLSPSITEPEK